MLFYAFLMVRLVPSPAGPMVAEVSIMSDHEPTLMGLGLWARIHFRVSSISYQDAHDLVKEDYKDDPWLFERIK